jgi:hypothetical protein
VTAYSQKRSLATVKDLCLSDEVLELCAMHHLDRASSANPEMVHAHLQNCRECAARLQAGEVFIGAIRAAFRQRTSQSRPKPGGTRALTVR